MENELDTAFDTTGVVQLKLRLTSQLCELPSSPMTANARHCQTLQRREQGMVAVND